MTDAYIITGAFSPIGRALARQIAPAAARLYLNDPSSAIAGPPPTDRESPGATVEWVPGSLADRGTAEKLFDAALKDGQALRGVVHCHSLPADASSLLDISAAEWRNSFQPHVTGAFNLSREFAVAARSRQPGALVLVASLSGISPSAGGGMAVVADAALAVLAQCVADEIGKHGARAYAVCPASDAEPDRVASMITSLITHPRQLATVLECSDGLRAYRRTSSVTVMLPSEVQPLVIAAVLGRL